MGKAGQLEARLSFARVLMVAFNDRIATSAGPMSQSSSTPLTHFLDFILLVRTDERASAGNNFGNLVCDGKLKN